MLFDLTHILYMLVSAFITAGLLVVAYFFVKKQESKERILKFVAVLTVAVHFSSLWVDFFATGDKQIQESMLLPIYPCNICMWLLLITAYVKKREGVAYTILAEFTFWAGVVCGSIGIILNENYASTPSLLDYDIFKGLFSHSTMVFGALYLRVGGFVKMRVFNTVSVICGLLFFILDGVVINALYRYFGRGDCNCMYLQENPFPNLPWLSSPVMGMMAVVLVFTITCIYEQITLPAQERWYVKIDEYKSQRISK